jgi:hypothetical protein
MRRHSLVVAALLLVLVAWTGLAYSAAQKQAFATFKQGGIHSGYCNSPGELLEVYIYGSNINEFYTAVEYQLLLPPCLVPIAASYYSNTQVTNGNPWTGVQQAFYPPINGFFPGLDLWASVIVQCTGSCDDCGFDQPVVMGPHPVSNALQGTRNDSDATLFQIVGLTSILCPGAVGTEETTWGKVKALFQDSR